MKNKNKISSYNYNIMKNNKFENKMKKFSFYQSLLPKKYEKYYDVISKLYVERHIEKVSQVEKLFKN